MKSTINALCATVECVWSTEAMLGEGPCWDQRSGRLLWVDIKGSRLYAFSPRNGEKASWNLPVRLCSLDLPQENWLPPRSLSGEEFIACGDMGLSWLGLEKDTAHVISLSNPEHDQPRNRFNDGKMGPDGRYWAGTMDDQEELVSGRLYAFHPDGTFDMLDEGYRVPNGPAFAPDQTTVYHTDSASRKIYAFNRNANGRLVQKRTFIQFGEHEGCPDGMTTDYEGNLWVAMWNGACIYKLSSGGERLGVISIPTQRPTSCVFAGPDCSELFVTSARLGLTGNDTLAGGLFRIDLKP